MLSNISSDGWSVKMDSIPASITVTQLSKTLGLPKSYIYLQKVNNHNNHYALVNYFVSENEANKFARQWSGESILSKTIKCIVVAPTSDERETFYSSHEPLISDIEATPNKQHQSRSNREFRGRRHYSTPPIMPAPLMSIATSETANFIIDNIQKKPPLHNSYQNLNQQQYQTSSSVLRQAEISDSSATRNTIRKQSIEDKRPLCRYANRGICREKSNECKYRHQRCQNYQSCSNLNCHLAHAKRQTGSQPYLSISSNSLLSSDSKDEEQDRYIPYSTRYESDSNSPISSIKSMNKRGKPCDSGIDCFRVDCKFDHPDGWNPCYYGVTCRNYKCTANHPFQRKKKCRDGVRCKITDCKFLHPNMRAMECPLRTKCTRLDCPWMHPRSRTWVCRNGAICTNLKCLCLHPPERDELFCQIGADCQDVSCKLNHPVERPSIYDQTDTGSNLNCAHLHGTDWNPGETGDQCEDEQSDKIDPPQCIVSFQQKTAMTTMITKISFILYYFYYFLSFIPICFAIFIVSLLEILLSLTSEI